MKLTELEPKWVGISGDGIIWEKRSENVRFGVTFRCPHCGARVGVMFKPFIDPDGLAPLIQWTLPGAPDPNTGEVREVKWWRREGDSFDDLTLTPSVNVDGHWHGHITNGAVA
jgi:hypothetical protein